LKEKEGLLTSRKKLRASRNSLLHSSSDSSGNTEDEAIKLECIDNSDEFKQPFTYSRNSIDKVFKT